MESKKMIGPDIHHKNLVRLSISTLIRFFWGGPDSALPPLYFFGRSTLKVVQSGGHEVYKSKLLHWKGT